MKTKFSNKKILKVSPVVLLCLIILSGLAVRCNYIKQKEFLDIDEIFSYLFINYPHATPAPGPEYYNNWQTQKTSVRY